METQAPHRGAVAFAVVFILSCVVLILFVFRSLGGHVPLSAKGYRVHALFDNASNLVSNADVRIAGVNIGKVVSVSQTGLRANATLELNPSYAPLPSDARAILRQKTLLGETFVAMTPGTPGATKIADGGTLAISQIAPTQTLDRLLDTLDAPTRHHLTTLLADTAAALQGRGAELNDAIGSLDPTTNELASIVAILDHQQGSVQRLVGDGATVLQTVGDHGAALQRVVSAGDAVLATTAQRNVALESTVRALAPFLAQLRSTLADVDQAAALAAPTIASLRPVAPLLRPALVNVDVLAPKFRDLVVQFRPLIGVARRALPAATQIIKALVPLSDQLYPLARQVTPGIDLVSRYATELTSAMANTGAALQSTGPSANGPGQHQLRTLAPINEESQVGYSQRLPSNRHNAYFAPGELANLGNGGLQTSDCRDVSNPPTAPVIGTGAPPCRLQPPFSFNGLTQYFPHLTQAPP
ncbi:MAG: MlaD family protein [Solirubrobacteraceae bacterium]|nr:MAG: hypothetical protein DLM63_07450 [Solirubrobacterales bacterium]